MHEAAAAIRASTDEVDPLMLDMLNAVAKAIEDTASPLTTPDARQVTIENYFKMVAVGRLHKVSDQSRAASVIPIVEGIVTLVELLPAYYLARVAGSMELAVSMLKSSAVTTVEARQRERWIDVLEGKSEELVWLASWLPSYEPLAEQALEMLHLIRELQG